ncbi:hypothetical protein FCULG_00008503 [Fusarium culmorum]|uniref:Uncharacterized protein n=1 Tax=Fusarium culmorum TaxID=5516 RepID=A0A2T4H2R8_FUSCU|nr:hypothetical protein FCULG_00008503 [Fusarium culmorum]
MKKPWKSGAGAAPSAQPVDSQPSAIRGRISGPVPIPTSMDDEFPIRNPGTSIATPVQGEFQESQPEPTPSRSDFRSPTFPEPRHNEASSFREEPRHSVHARHPGTASRLQKAEPSNRHSFVSTDRSQTKERPQRKQSTLRGALGKLFNRKKKVNDNESTGNTDSEAGSVPVRPGPYRRSTAEDGRPQDSVPSLNHKDRSAPRTRSRPFPGAESKRSASLPITEFDRALRSHSIRPEDVRAIESARNSLSADFGLTHAAKLREYSLAGLSPRPASSHGRESRQDQHDENADEIGRAITSDLGVRRRSRSLSGLPEDGHGLARRRSDEIKYWRESYDPGFTHPISSNVADVEDGVTAEAEHTQHTQEEDQQQQAEPFNFGSFADMKQVGSMKITHAANMETRINNLESRVYQLEQVLDRMCDGGWNRQSHFEPPERSAPQVPVEQRSSAKVMDDQADWAREDNKKTLGWLNGHSKGSHRGSMFLDPSSPAILSDGNKDRPASTATVRGTTSLPNLLQDTPGTFTMDHYTTLVALIHTERSAREALETQVKTLGHQLTKSFGDRSAFDHDDDDENLASLAVITRSHSRHVDPEDSGIGTGHGDDSEYSDTFETPREEGGHMFGAFGEDLDREDQAQTKAARTLSLSQLTMGRGTQKSSQHLRRVI